MNFYLQVLLNMITFNLSIKIISHSKLDLTMSRVTTFRKGMIALNRCFLKRRKQKLVTKTIAMEIQKRIRVQLIKLLETNHHKKVNKILWIFYLRRKIKTEFVSLMIRC